MTGPRHVAADMTLPIYAKQNAPKRFMDIGYNIDLSLIIFRFSRYRHAYMSAWLYMALIYHFD